MASADFKVAVEILPIETSIPVLLDGLNVGESYSRSQRFDADTLTKKQLNDAIDWLGSTMHSSLRAVRLKNKRFMVETGEWRTRSRDIVITAIATRTR